MRETFVICLTDRSVKWYVVGFSNKSASVLVAKDPAEALPFSSEAQAKQWATKWCDAHRWTIVPRSTTPQPQP